MCSFSVHHHHHHFLYHRHIRLLGRSFSALYFSLCFFFSSSICNNVSFSFRVSIYTLYALDVCIIITKLLLYPVLSYTWKTLIGQSGQKKTVDVVIVVVPLLEMLVIRSSSHVGFQIIMNSWRKTIILVVLIIEMIDR